MFISEIKKSDVGIFPKLSQYNAGGEPKT